MEARSPHGRSGRRWRSDCPSRSSSYSKPRSPSAACARLASSARCSGESEAISRLAAAARRASESISSSRLRGFSGKKSPHLLDGLVQQLADLLEDAAEAAALAELPALLPRVAHQVPQAAHAGHAAAQQRGERLARPVALQHPLADAVERLTQVERRLQRVRPALPGPVAGSSTQ